MAFTPILGEPRRGFHELENAFFQALKTPRQCDVRLVVGERPRWTGWYSWLLRGFQWTTDEFSVRLTLAEWNRFINAIGPQYQMQVARSSLLCSCEQVANSLWGGDKNRLHAALRLVAPRVILSWYLGECWEHQSFFGRLYKSILNYFWGRCMYTRSGTPCVRFEWEPEPPGAANLPNQESGGAGDDGRNDEKPVSTNAISDCELGDFERLGGVGTGVDERDSDTGGYADKGRKTEDVVQRHEPGETEKSKRSEACPRKTPPAPPDPNVLPAGMYCVGDYIHSAKGDTIHGSGITGVRGIVGGNNQSGEAKIVGVRLAPTQTNAVVYANTPENIKTAIEERKVKKSKACTLTKEDRQKIGKTVSAAMGKSGHSTQHIFSKEQIQREIEAIVGVEALKSNKWSEKRFKQTLEKLSSSWNIDYQFSTKIKLEPMGADAAGNPKPPRFLIADGDLGQVMAVLVVSVFERLMFAHQKERSIKGRARKKALSEVAKALRPFINDESKEKKEKYAAGGIEGDGSAWDTCCSHELREMIENPILEHIASVLFPYFKVPPEWSEKHLEANKKPTIKLVYRDKVGRYVWDILAIRRSGHRGTSSLNFWVNLVCWVCSIAKEPWTLLDPKRTTFIDVEGNKRWWKGVFEGDDSLCRVAPKVLPGSSFHELFIRFWDRAGHNMKLVFVENRAEFCGTHYHCKDGDLIGTWCPDLKRCLKNWGISCTPGTLENFKAGKFDELRKTKVCACLSRALDFAGILPRLSQKFIDTAITDSKVPHFDKYLDDTVQNPEFKELLRCHLDGADVLPSTVLSAVQTQNLGLDVPDIRTFSHLPKADLSKDVNKVWKKKEQNWPIGHHVDSGEELQLLHDLYGITPSAYETLLATPFTIGGTTDEMYDKMVDELFAHQPKA